MVNGLREDVPERTKTRVRHAWAGHEQARCGTADTVGLTCVPAVAGATPHTPWFWFATTQS